MIKYCIRIFYLSTLALFSWDLFGNSPERTSFMPHAHYHIVDNDDRPSQALLDLLSLVGIQHDGSWPSIIDATQKAWLRKQGSERWDIAAAHEDKRAEILKLLWHLGCIEAVEPTQKQYDYAIILGATVFRVRTRLSYLIDLWNQGIRFKTVVFLGSERKLDAKPEPKELLLDSKAGNKYADPAWAFSGTLPTTEYEMIRFVVEQTALPVGFEAVSLVFINTPNQQKADGTLVRATTADTINYWMDLQPLPGSCLFVSNQPYIGYQDAAIRCYMPEAFKIETVGQQASDKEDIAVHLDNLARWLYQENQRRMMHS